ncbi:hypothetical protein H8K90_16545 [Winogradskyella echinorum]|uniref:Uncharacterized protein n=1 Tax=Winogradskyella echinorum TaxID=538189 RepID=A0ABR6Y5M2_9FLAO|nr:hypothetical protein [Winogradskyella echinorum]MBC5752354.1 hypothetical protein [Winogradskyella echinorum]
MKKFQLIVIVLIFAIIAKFWIGIYEHDEFGSKHFFIKHRAIWKSYFYSPIGMSDSLLSQFPSEEQKEQMLFEEFVSSKGHSK